MERLVEVTLSKVNILSMLDCYYRLFPLIYISYDSEGITIQGPAGPIGTPHIGGPVVPTGSCEERKILATMVILRDSFEHYECKEFMVIALPNDLKKLGGRCERINVLSVDSWRVRNVFEFDNGVSYEALSSYMYKLTDHPQMESAISFERYPAAKKCLGGVDVEVSVRDGIASFRGEIFHISTFTIGEPGEPYCTIPDEHLKLLNKFLGPITKGSRIDYCKKEDDFLLSVDKEHNWIDIRLRSTKA